MTKRVFTFFCRTEVERDIWVYVFEIVAAMNAANIPIAKYNPFDVSNLAISLLESGEPEPTVDEHRSGGFEE